MKIKTIIFSLLAAVSLTANAQVADVLSVKENKGCISDASLNGKAGVLFVGESGDYVIESTIHEKCQSAEKVNDHYEYRMVIDLKGRKNDSRVFIVTKKGTPYRGESVSKFVYADSISRYSITEISTKLGCTEEIKNASYLDEKGNNPDSACIEIAIPQDLIQKFSLKVNINKALNAKIKSVAKAGNVVHEVVFSTKRLSHQLEEIVTNYQKQIDEIIAKTEAEKDERVKQDLYKQQDYIHDTLLVQAQNDLANAATITIEGKGVNTLTIDPIKIRSLKPKDKLLYGVVVVEKEVIKEVVKEVAKEYSFDELLAQARKRYQEYPQHTDFAFYEGAMTAYKNARNHKDCPDAMREALLVEYDSILSIRRWVGYYEQAGKMVSDSKRGDDKELTYLEVQQHCIQQLLQYHPEIEGLNSILGNVKKRIEQIEGQRELDLISKTTEIKAKAKRQRQRVSGKISFANELLKRPFGSLQIYGSSTEKVDRKSSSRIGSVNDDGSYSVLIPDHTRYIYVTGEKKAHYIGDGRDELDIEIR